MMLLDGKIVNNKLFSKAFFLILAITLVVMVISTPVFAASNSTVINEESIIARMNEQGIDKNVQESLMKKIKNGELLDCEKPEQIQEATKHLKVSRENPKAEYTFDDGSKIIREIIVEKEEITPSGVIENTITVKDGTTFITAEYKAKILLNTDYTASSILNVWDDRITVISGDFSNEVLRIISPTQQGITPAHARLSFKYQYKALGWEVRTGTAWLELFVRDTNYWTSWSY
ncbi:MAG: hypothetical protein GX790_02050 [Syntrophomonadaceae bacterium]|nr:hypothetical protein [Syntrophomonadaceae bacterium]